MLAVTSQYKEHMRVKDRLRNPTYIRVTLGLINQEAQAKAYIPNPENYTYYSNLKMPLDSYQVQELYITCDQNYTVVDGSMYFLPRNKADVVLNQGIVSDQLFGDIKIRFPLEYNIKGLTIEFGRAFPVDFKIESDNNVVEVTGNTGDHYVSDAVFLGATYLRFVPVKMVNGQSRLRIHQITIGVGLSFDSRRILSATKKEYISPIMEELPAIDFELTVNNKDRAFDIENETSSVNFLEIGQEVKVLYGQELDDGMVEWLPGATVQLREWSADDEVMSFTATDRFDGMDGTYYKGMYRPEGISLYDLAADVFDDAGVDSRTYWLDPYLKKVIVNNPVPAVSHKEALQLIANAGRCILGQDRSGNIFMKSSFLPDMAAASDNEAYFSHAGRVLDGTPKDSYALAGRNEAEVVPAQYFLPRQAEGAVYLNTGYVSEAVAGLRGFFDINPTLEIRAEAAFKCFGLTLDFGRIYPAELVIHTWHDGILQEDYVVTEIREVTVVHHEFPEFDCMVLEFTRHNAPPDLDGNYTFWTDCDEAHLLDEKDVLLVKDGEPVPQESNNRIVLNNITFGDSTDYVLEYGCGLTKTPKGTQLPKVRELQVIQTLYNQSSELKELVKETIEITPLYNRYVFYFSNASYDLSAALTAPQEGGTVRIVEYSSYYAVVEVTGVNGAAEVTVNGREYMISRARFTRPLNPTGSVEQWENPLVSGPVHAADLAEWIGDYMKSDREYDLQYRGEPRIDANDILFLENKYVPDMVVRAYEHTLKFNGALSGTMKARRDMSYGRTGGKR